MGNIQDGFLNGMHISASDARAEAKKEAITGAYPILAREKDSLPAFLLGNNIYSGRMNCGFLILPFMKTIGNRKDRSP